MTTNYCENCGAKYSPKQQQQILFEITNEVQCAGCKNVRSFYSIPVAVLLQPVVTRAGEVGLLVKRQGKSGDPVHNGVILPRCFFHIGEDTELVLIRETGIDINPNTLRNFGVHTNHFEKAYTTRFDKYVFLFFF